MRWLSIAKYPLVILSGFHKVRFYPAGWREALLSVTCLAKNTTRWPVHSWNQTSWPRPLDPKLWALTVSHHLPPNSPFGNMNINYRLHCSTWLGLGKAWRSFQLEYSVAHTHERGKAFGKGAVGHFSTAWADKTGKLPGWIGNTLEVHTFFAH